jgi:nicotinamidase-related amidase
MSRRAFAQATPKFRVATSQHQGIASFGGFVEGDQSGDISPSIAPLERDILVTKRRVSAFSGSDLDVVLRGLNVDSFVLRV